MSTVLRSAYDLLDFQASLKRQKTAVHPPPHSAAPLGSAQPQAAPIRMRKSAKSGAMLSKSLIWGSRSLWRGFNGCTPSPLWSSWRWAAAFQDPPAPRCPSRSGRPSRAGLAACCQARPHPVLAHSDADLRIRRFFGHEVDCIWAAWVTDRYKIMQLLHHKIGMAQDQGLIRCTWRGAVPLPLSLFSGGQCPAPDAEHCLLTEGLGK